MRRMRFGKIEEVMVDIYADEKYNCGRLRIFEKGEVVFEFEWDTYGIKQLVILGNIKYRRGGA